MQLRNCLSGKYDVDLVEIQPEHKRRYLVWLAYSFLPDSRARINNVKSDVSSYDLVCLGAPKWTVSCPPLNEYLEMMTGCGGKRVVLFMTHGGFREHDFMRQVVRKVELKRPRVISILAIRRRNVADESYLKQVRDFCARLESLTPLANSRSESCIPPGAMNGKLHLLQEIFSPGAKSPGTCGISRLRELQ